MAANCSTGLQDGNVLLTCLPEVPKPIDAGSTGVCECFMDLLLRASLPFRVSATG